MIRVIMSVFIVCGDVNAASFQVDMKCSNNMNWDQTAQVLTCDNLKMIPKCNATYDPFSRTLTCSSTGNIDFQCPGGFKTEPTEPGTQAKYSCSDVGLKNPSNLRITIIK